MRRTIRCEHGFAKGLCRVEGCPHEERRGASQRRAKPTTCKGCGGEASVKVWKSGWLCQGCADLREARGRREMVHQYRGLYLLTALMLGCGGVDVPCLTDHQESDWSDPVPAGMCRIVELANDSTGFLSLAGECPEGEGRCIVLMPGERFQTWKRLSDPIPEFGSAELPLEPDGSCAATCE